jgi:hypothetical protein
VIIIPSLADNILSKTTSEEQLLYLKTLFQEAKTHLGKYNGADELMPALVDYLQKKYQPKELNPVLLQTIYTRLNEWRANDSGEDAYIFTCVQGALLVITSEAMPPEATQQEPLKYMESKCLQYIEELKQELKKYPDNKLVQKRLEIISKAYTSLQDTDDTNDDKTNLFFKLIADNHAIFNQDQHPRAKLFIKAVAVFMAFCLGAGIGGVFAYQKLFNQKDEEKPKEKLFNLSMFEPHPDQNLEREQEQDIKNKGDDREIKP